MIDNLLAQNKQWCEHQLKKQPNFFSQHKDKHQPQAFWLGCCDSRVPPEKITSCELGQLFVHRNVANLVYDTDHSLKTSLHYAVEGLGVEHIIICGHYGCAGVLCALEPTHLEHIPKWIRNIQETALKYQEQLSSYQTLKEKHDALVELNVIEQVKKVKELDTWKTHQQKKSCRLSLHGLVYDISTGLLKKIV